MTKIINSIIEFLIITVVGTAVGAFSALVIAYVVLFKR